MTPFYAADHDERKRERLWWWRQAFEGFACIWEHVGGIRLRAKANLLRRNSCLNGPAAADYSSDA
jgi:hypothetical protein